MFNESLGLTFAERMSSGVALLAMPIGFAAGLLDGKEYLQIRKRSAKYVASQLNIMLKSPHQCQTIAKNGYKRFQSLRWDLDINQINALYSDLIHVKGHKLKLCQLV